MNTKAVFWDNDGVLVDTERLYFDATRQVLASANIPLTRDEYVELFLRQGRGAWHLAEQRGIDVEEIDRLRRERDALYGRLLGEGSHAIDGVEEVLATLHGRVVMGIVTSSRRDHFDLIHQSSGLLRYFDFALTAGDYLQTKPQPDPYLAAIARSGFDADECFAVEDSERGLQSALAAGVRCIIVPTTLTRECAFAGAHCVVARAAYIPKVISIADR